MTLVDMADQRGPGWAGWRGRLRSFIFLVAVVVGVAGIRRPSLGAPGMVLLGVAAVGWLSALFAPSLRALLRRRLAADGPARSAGLRQALAPLAAEGRIDLLGVFALGLAGLWLSALAPQGPAIGFVAAACFIAGARTPTPVSFAITAGLSLGWMAVHVYTHQGLGWIFGGTGLLLVTLMAGLIRRQNATLAEETRLAREEQARSAALAERARIAREIHDVLAHSLAALTVQLETADALIEGGRAEQARQSVVRAGHLAREGLAETRRAISALRGETLPLPELLAGLAGEYRADLGAPASVRVDGEPEPVTADTGLAVYRTAQEAMTNVRKHAPGAPVELTLRYEPDAVRLSVANGAPPPSERPLADSGGGYGLTGLRERAELAGGRFTAGPDGDGWRVDVRIPL